MLMDMQPIGNMWNSSQSQFWDERKNRKEGDIFYKCDDFDIGVDLNRNYPYKFMINEVGSSSNPCDETYSGEYAFSEP